MTEIKELIAKANEQCKRIKEYITENKGMFSSMDLKLHDASFYEFGNMKNDFPMCFKENEDRSCGYTYFYDFCEDRYDQFEEWCKEEKINFRAMCHHIGSTSSFYLYEKKFIEKEYGEIRWSLTMGNIFDELVYPSSNMVEFDLNGNIDEEKTFNYESDYYTKEEWAEEVKPSLQYIIDEMYDDFIKEITDVKKVYEYIKDIKENQVEYFKEYLEFYESELQEEKNKCDRENAKRIEIIMKMPETIRNIMMRSALDSDDLAVVLGCFA